MRISIDCRHIGKSGIGTYTLNLTRSLVKHKEHQYLLLVEYYLDEFNSLDNVRQFICDIKPFSKTELFKLDCSEINKCDVYLSPYINLSWGIKVPIYITIHDVIFMDLPHIVGIVGYWFRRFYLKWAIWKSKGIFTVSKFSESRIKIHFGDKKPIRVVHNVVGEKIKNSPIVNAEKDDYLIYVGNVKQHKGLRTLLDAYRLAKIDGLSSGLKIVGETDSFRTKDSTIAHMLENLDGLEFTGRVSDEDLIQLISKAKALVQPSLYEGFGIPPMEALYLGTHAIVSDIDVLKEVYKDLPVSFFKVKDVCDLKTKILSLDKSLIDIAMVRNHIDALYNMDESAEIVLDLITK